MILVTDIKSLSFTLLFVFTSSDVPQPQHELENMESSFAALPGSSQHSAKTKDSPPKYKVASVAAAPSDFSDHLSDSTRQANITSEM